MTDHGQPIKIISSSEFRRTYAHLEEEVGVTANGRLFGIWQPIRMAERNAPASMFGLEPGVLPPSTFTEFRPVPKPSQRKRHQ